MPQEEGRREKRREIVLTNRCLHETGQELLASSVSTLVTLHLYVRRERLRRTTTITRSESTCVQCWSQLVLWSKWVRVLPSSSIRMLAGKRIY